MNFKLSIRRRLILFFLLLAFLPLLAIRFALALQQGLLEQQAQMHQHTVQKLALILEARPELWGETRYTGQVLSHIDFNQAAIWLVNNQGQTTYVMGHLNPPERLPWLVKLNQNWLALLFAQHDNIHAHQTSEAALIERALQGETSQFYRSNERGQAYSLMSASPIYSQGEQVGAVVYEQTLATLYHQTLEAFYHLITLAGLLIGLLILGLLIYAGSLSNRIIRLQQDVKVSFSNSGQPNVNPMHLKDSYSDEISDLRQSIIEMLEKISHYDRYLKQLPKTLRHELHNPINRLSASLELLQMKAPHPQLDKAEQALAQLKHIIEALSQASSLEQSLHQHSLLPYSAVPKLDSYFESVVLSQPAGRIEYKRDQSVNPELKILAEGFLIEQLLDKLIDNAIEFDNGECPIQIELTQHAHRLNIKICNCGQSLPQGFEQQIFEGMVSIRAPSPHTHLGLGLHMARLIAEYHQAQLTAHNQEQGVCFEIDFTLM